MFLVGVVTLGVSNVCPTARTAVLRLRSFNTAAVAVLEVEDAMTRMQSPYLVYSCLSGKTQASQHSSMCRISCSSTECAFNQQSGSVTLG